MRVNILYSSDDNYAQHAGLSLISLFHNNKLVGELCVYIIDNEISIKNKNRLLTIAKEYNREIVFLPIMQLCNNLKKTDDFPLSAYARLFITQVQNIDKIVYIDCDTIINNSIEDLWKININNYLVAGVQDNPANYNVSAIGMNGEDRYINSGVLLMNLKMMREYNFEEKVIAFVERYNGCVPHEDQGIINGVCRGKILILEPKYNMMSQFLLHTSLQIQRLYKIKNYYEQQQIEVAVKEPVIIHYISKFYGRPWDNGCTHPMKSLYENYLNQSEWPTKYSNSKSTLGLKVRCWVYRNMPFSIYCMFEHSLDIKRKKYLKNKYSYLNMKF